jgi:hypothetical protein
MGWKVRGSNPVGGEIFRTYPDRPWGPPSLLYNGYRVLPGGKGGRDMTLTTQLYLVPRSWKSRAIPLLPLWDRVACYRVKPYLTLPYSKHKATRNIEQTLRHESRLRHVWISLSLLKMSTNYSLRLSYRRRLIFTCFFSSFAFSSFWNNQPLAPVCVNSQWVSSLTSKKVLNENIFIANQTDTLPPKLISLVQWIISKRRFK